jgi:hypothetical protein
MAWRAKTQTGRRPSGLAGRRHAAIGMSTNNSRSDEKRDRGGPFQVVRARLRMSAHATEGRHSTVTLFARLRGLSTSVPRAQAV